MVIFNDSSLRKLNLTYQSCSGIIVNEMEDNKVTVKDVIAKETIVDVKDVKDTKVGDKVIIKDGTIEKLSEKPKSPRSLKNQGY